MKNRPYTVVRVRNASEKVKHKIKYEHKLVNFLDNLVNNINNLFKTK